MVKKIYLRVLCDSVVELYLFLIQRCRFVTPVLIILKL